ncbi:MAG: hypothetical protein PIR02_07040 [Microbacterium enclense]
MTVDISPSPQPLATPPAGDRFGAWILWPAATAMLGGLPFLLASALSNGRNRTGDDFWEPIRAIGQWAQPAFSTGFDTLALFGALVALIGAITGFSGDWSRLTRRARNLFSALTTLAAVLLLALANLTPSVIATSPGSSSQTIVLWAAAWGVMLVTLAVSEVLPLRKQVALARLRALRAAERVTRIGYGLPPDDAPPVRFPAGSFLALFGVPIAAWSVFCIVVASEMNAPVSIGALFVALGYGGFISLVGWVLRSDATSTTLPRTVSLIAIVLGILVSVIFGIVSAPVSGAISIGLFVAAAASLVLLLPETVTRRLPVLGRVQRWRTLQSLQSLRTRSKTMQERWRARRPTTDRPPLWRRLIRAFMD